MSRLREGEQLVWRDPFPTPTPLSLEDYQTRFGIGIFVVERSFAGKPVPGVTGPINELIVRTPNGIQAHLPADFFEPAPK